jgi:hypothetical protein
VIFSFRAWKRMACPLRWSKARNGWLCSNQEKNVFVRLIAPPGVDSGPVYLPLGRCPSAEGQPNSVRKIFRGRSWARLISIRA